MLALLAVLALAAAAAPAPAPDPLAASLLQRLSFEGSAEERAFYEALTRRLLESPTARELAAAAAASRLPATVRFAELPGTELYERREGRRAFTADQAGRTLRSPDGVTIELNRACLSIDAEYARLDCVRHYAHELLGHALGLLRADDETQRAAYVYYDDEYEARLVGWIVTAELSEDYKDPEPACALADPAAYRAYIRRTYPSSSAGLALEDYGDPLAAWRGRRAQSSAKARGLLAEEISYFDGPGRERLARFAQAAAQPYFRGLPAYAQSLESRLSARGDRLFHAADCGDYR